MFNKPKTTDLDQAISKIKVRPTDVLKPNSGRTLEEQTILEQKAEDLFVRETLSDMQRRNVRPMIFVKPDTPFHPGEIAGFKPYVCQKLIEAKKAEVVPLDEVEKKLREQFRARRKVRSGHKSIGALMAKIEDTLDKSDSDSEK